MSFDTEEGEFKQDHELINILAENMEEFEVLVQTKGLCDISSATDDKVELPAYCKEIMKKLGLVDVEYHKYVDPNTEEVSESIKLIVYSYSGWLFHYYDKGYYFNYDSSQIPNLYEGDLNTKPHGNCDNYSRYKNIDEEGVNKQWYLYAYEFCD